MGESLRVGGLGGELMKCEFGGDGTVSNVARVASRRFAKVEAIDIEDPLLRARNRGVTTI